MKKIPFACLSFSLLFVQAAVALTPPGGLDLSFNGTGIVTTFPTLKGTGFTGNDVVQQADGKLVAVGYRNNSKGVQNFAVLRYNSDGSLDTTFNGTGAVTTVFGTFLKAPVDYAQSVIQQTDGKLVVAGSSSLDGGSSDAAQFYSFALARYNKDGSLDETFDEDGLLTTGFDVTNHNDKCYSVIQQADGKLVAAGTSSTSGGEGDDFALARYNSNGSLDTSFGDDGKVVTPIGTASKKDSGRSVIQLADGRLLMVGSSQSAFAMVMYNEDGSLDTSFDGDGKMFADITANVDVGFSVIQQADEQIVITGYSATPGAGNDFAIARYNLDGTPDTTFNGTGKLILPVASGSGGDYAESVIQQADEKLVIGGYSNNNFALVRLNTDGSLDTTFGTNGKQTAEISAATNLAHSVIQQSDGKLVLAGFVSGKVNSLTLARYQSEQDFDDDGVPDSLDALFEDKAESVDTDGDLIGNEADTDDDNDGIPDTTDNCPLISNSDQADRDNYGLGDACDDQASLLFTANGIKTKDRAGYAVAFAGDVNKDSYGDYVVGMSGYDVAGKVDAGRAEVISGKTGLVLMSVEGAAAKDAMGFAVAGNADVNNDTYPDVVIGAPKADANGLVDAGAVTVLYGEANLPTRTIVNSTMNGQAVKALFGSAVALGDVNSDNYADIIVGAPKDDNKITANIIDAGSVTVLSGDTDNAPLKTFYGATPKAYAGTSVAVGNFDGAGDAEIIIGAPNDDDKETDPEKVYIDAGSVSVYGIADTDPVIKLYGAVAKAYLGKSVASADMDGVPGDEILAGAPGDDILNDDGKAIKKDVGSVTLFSGGDGFLMYQYYGRTLKAGLGNSVAFGDVNADGVPDIIAGASKDDKPAAKKPIKDTGSVSVWNGADYGLIATVYGAVTKDYFGATVSAGNANNDVNIVSGFGYDDLIIGIGGADVVVPPLIKPSKDAGSVQVLSGQHL